MNKLTFYAVCMILLSNSHADTITLKNGQCIDGIIISENATSITVDIGIGKAKFEKNRIKSIAKSTTAQKKKLENGWKNEYFLQKSNIPAGCESITDTYNALNDKRSAIQRVTGSISASQEQVIQKQLDTIHEASLELHKKLLVADPKKDSTAYNELITSNNKLAAELAVKNSELQSLMAARDQAHTLTTSYIKELSQLQTSYSNLYESASTNPDSTDILQFLERLKPKIKGLSVNVENHTIRAEKFGRNLLVTACINDTNGRFILDTGASMVCMSQEFADRAKIIADQSRTIEMIVADGRKVKAPKVLLKSVQVGDAVSENVEGVIITSSGTDKIDGLLGMSFLQNYTMSYESGNGKLTLTRFASP